jgi:hypothetical protein
MPNDIHQKNKAFQALRANKVRKIDVMTRGIK